MMFVCVINAGETICCPECDLDIGRLKKPFYKGNLITVDLIEWLALEFTYGDETTCPKCDAYWSIGGFLFVKGKGWQPRG